MQQGYTHLYTHGLETLDFQLSLHAGHSGVCPPPASTRVFFKPSCSAESLFTCSVAGRCYRCSGDGAFHRAPSCDWTRASVPLLSCFCLLTCCSVDGHDQVFEQGQRPDGRLTGDVWRAGFGRLLSSSRTPLNFNQSLCCGFSTSYYGLKCLFARLSVDALTPPRCDCQAAGGVFKETLCICICVRTLRTQCGTRDGRCVWYCYSKHSEGQ